MHTIRLLRLATVVTLVLPACTTGCGPELPAVVRAGDAIPRSRTEPTLIDAITPLLATPSAPRLEVVPWSLDNTGLGGVEADQARIFAQDPSVIAAVGHSGSKVTLLASPIYRDAGLPLIIPTATARELRAIPGFFMLAPSDDAVGAFLVDAAVDSLQGTRVALMHVADAYGEGMSRGIIERMDARGLTLVANTVMTGRECAQDEIAAKAIASSLLQRASPDVVILALSQEATICVIRLLVQAAPAIHIIASDSYIPSEHVGITAAERRAVHALSFWEPGTDSLSVQFVAAYRATTGRAPDPGQALAYDAFLLIRQAILESHLTREAISRWLRELGTAKHAPMIGVTGPIDFQAPRRAVLHLRHLSDARP